MAGKPTEKSQAEKAVQILVCFIISIYPLALFQLNLGSFQVQSLLLFLCAMGVLLYCFLLIRSGKWELRLRRNKIDLLIFILAIYAVCRVIARTVSGGADTLSHDFELVVLALTALYLLIESKPVFQDKYFELLLFSGLLVFACLLIRYICWAGMREMLPVLGQTEIASYTLLVCTAGLWRYCQCKDKLRSIFYLGVLLVGFLVLFINQNWVSIWLMAMAFVAIPILERTTAELVKRDMQVFFVYLFLLCNMSLLTNYTNLLIEDVNYDLEHSVYLELLVAIGGLFFFKYWDRIPEGVDLHRLVMRKMRRGYKFLFGLMSIAFIGIILGGDDWKALPDTGGLAAVKGFAVPLAEEVWQGKGGVHYCFEQLGLLGGLLFLIAYIVCWSRLQKSCGFDKPTTTVLVLIAGIFLIQLLFWKVSMNSLPIYWVFMIFAFYYKEERERVISTKIKFEEKVE